ncbi:MAG: hypothetical protein KF799_16205 [Bdellovibrionales bacterium]|nr:hypothetical protein [Bdellovibrionales bacterium]
MQKTHAYRRCHVCGATCEAPSQVRHCSSCKKPFAPFYYFNDQFSPVQYDAGLRPTALEGEWRPIQGLTAYWQMD